MIKKFKKYNEGINHLLVGPTDEEIKDNILSIDDSPEQLKLFSLISRCRNNDIYMILKILRMYDFTNEGLDECIKVSKNKQIIDLLESYKK